MFMSKREITVKPFTLRCFSPQQAPISYGRLSPWALREIYESPKLVEVAEKNKDYWTKVKNDDFDGYIYLPFGEKSLTHGSKANVLFASCDLLITALVPSVNLRHFEETDIEFNYHNLPYLDVTFDGNGEITSVTNYLEDLNIDGISDLEMIAFTFIEIANNLLVTKELVRILKLPKNIPQTTDMMAALGRAIKIINARNEEHKLKVRK